MMETNTQIAVRDIAALVAENLRRLDEGAAAQAALDTGFESLDRLTGGLRLGELVVLGGRTSMGKTQFLVNLAAHVSQTRPVLYVSFDLPAEQLAGRFMSAASGVPMHHILRGEMDEVERERLAAVGNFFDRRQILIAQDCPASIEVLKDLCEKHIAEDGVGVIVVDFLQMVYSENRFRRHTREMELSHICRELKNLAREADVCLIASSQLSRNVEVRGGSKRPQLSDLRESGSIEQDADKVLFIHRPEYYGFSTDNDNMPAAGLVEIHVAKNRNGPTNTIRLRRNGAFTRFEEWDDHAVELTFPPDRLAELEKPF